MPSTTVSPSRTGLVGHDAVKRRNGLGLLEHVLVARERGHLRSHVAAGGVGLRLGLVHLGHSLGHGGDVEIVSGFLGVVVLLGHDAVFIESLSAVPVELFLLEVGLGVVDVGFGGLFGSNVGGDVGLGGGDGGFLAV